VTDILGRIRALVALAGSDREEEARTSAHLACKLMREHKVEFVLPGGEGHPPNADEEGNLYGDPFSAVGAWWRRAETRARKYRSGYDQSSQQGYEDYVRDQRRRQGGASGARADNAPPPCTKPPFDPFTVSFELVVTWAKSRGVEILDNEDGSYSFHAGHDHGRGTKEDAILFAIAWVEREARRARGGK